MQSAVASTSSPRAWYQTCHLQIQLPRTHIHLYTHVHTHTQASLVFLEMRATPKELPPWASPGHEVASLQLPLQLPEQQQQQQQGVLKVLHTCRHTLTHMHTLVALCGLLCDKRVTLICTWHIVSISAQNSRCLACSDHCPNMNTGSLVPILGAALSISPYSSPVLCNT